MGITPESLQSGKVLTFLIERFCRERSREHLAGVLRCLRDSMVWVPMRLRLSKEDERQLLAAEKGDVVSAKADAGLTPDILTDGEGGLFFPVFSQTGQMPDAYKDRFSVMQLPFITCADMVAERRDVESVVINPFSNGMVLTPELLDVVRRLPSELKQE